MSQPRAGVFGHGRAYLYLAFAVLLVLGAAIPLSRIPGVTEQLPQGPVSMIVTLTTPRDGMQTTLYTPIPIRATANGQEPVQSFDLWVDGTRLETKAAEGSSASWTWSADSSGTHTFIARARDASGHYANSNTVRVQVSTKVNPGMDVMYSVQAGDTLDSIAGKYGSTADQILGTNPELKAGKALVAGTRIRVPLVPEIPAVSPTGTPAPASSGGPAPSGSPNRYVFWASKFLNPIVPSAPDLAAGVNKCSVALVITDHSNDELGFNVYRLDTNAQSYKLIKVLGANGNSAAPFEYDDQAVYGTFSYYVAAFNAAGEGKSNVTTATVSDAACQTPYWAGLSLSAAPHPVALSDYGAPSASTKVDKAYFYLSKGGGERERVPNDPNAFLPLPNGIFNPDEQISNLSLTPTQGTLVVDLDAWGWSGGNLVHIGDFRRTLVPQAGGIPGGATTVGTPSELDFCINCGGETSSNNTDPLETTDFEPISFKWFLPAEVQDGFWEVSLLPLPNACDSHPTGLVASGPVKASDKDQYGKWVDFKIDFSTLKGKTAPFGDLQIGGKDQQKFYIHVMSVQNGSVVCQLSNTLEYTAGAPTPKVVLGGGVTPLPPAPAPPTLQVQVQDFQTIQFPDYSQQYCVIVVQNPYTDAQTVLNYLESHPGDPYIAKFAGVPVGTEVCPDAYNPPPPDDPHWYDVVGGWIEDAINAVANLYNDAVSLVKDLVAEFNPVCIQAKFVADELAPQYKGSVDDACKAVASVAVDAVLTSAGLPPSLPNFDQLKQVGEGYLVDAAAQELEDQTGVPCDDSHPIPGEPSCKDLIRTGLDDMVAQAEQSQSDSSCFGGDTTQAHARYIEPLCTPDGVVTKPVPAGQLQPANMTIQVTEPSDYQVPDASFTVQCRLSSGVTADNNIPAFDWSGGAEGFPPGESSWPGGSVTAQPFLPAGNVALPPMTPGETLQIPVVLTPNHFEGNVTYTGQPSGYWLPQHENFIHDWVGANGDTYVVDDWMKLYFGSTLHASAYAYCTTSAPGYAKGTSSSSSDTVNRTVGPGPY